MSVAKGTRVSTSLLSVPINLDIWANVPWPLKLKACTSCRSAVWSHKYGDAWVYIRLKCAPPYLRLRLVVSSTGGGWPVRMQMNMDAEININRLKEKTMEEVIWMKGTDIKNALQLHHRKFIQLSFAMNTLKLWRLYKYQCILCSRSLIRRTDRILVSTKKTMARWRNQEKNIKRIR
jgi:hypothetical protein